MHTLPHRGGPDFTRISLTQDEEIRFWTRELGVSPAELRNAVAIACSSADEVRKFLRRR